MEPRPFYLCDIDGTIADLTHRLNYINEKPANWDAFFAACPDDAPIANVIKTIQLLAKSGAGIVLLTGRSDAVREQTTQWLVSNSVPFYALYMRKHGDHRQDDIVKGELLDEVIKDVPLDYILGAFEDRDQVVKMLRERGVRVFQVAEGNF